MTIYHEDHTFACGTVFRCQTQGDRSPEIYGWLERDFAIVPGSGGWWRTDDPVEARNRCAARFDLAGT